MVNTLFNAYRKYDCTLHNVGYVKNTDMYNVLILQYIYDVLSNEDVSISDEQYNVLNKVLRCLFNSSCLLSGNTFKGSLKNLTASNIAKGNVSNSRGAVITELQNKIDNMQKRQEELENLIVVIPAKQTMD